VPSVQPTNVSYYAYEIVALKHYPPEFRKRDSLQEERDKLTRKISLIALICYICLDNTPKTPASTTTTQTGPGHIRVSYNHVHVPVRIWGSKLGCTATTDSYMTFRESMPSGLRKEHYVVYMTMILTPHLDFHTGFQEKVHSCFIF
jgi:hypothetical protein